ncbi:MAG: metal-dependent phosphohydrolase [Oscillatoria sp. PMC 1051.18]|nr:metal-dependent phosphohydrolase [Oscillatoria sp. PMC 1050.18]MEC5030160.1 metal-dependent phosphohydrolase [Oscillatoria sp. PMC 1051.18]
MYSSTQIVIDNCTKSLQAGYLNTYDNLKPEYADLIGEVAEITLGKISQSDAPYHDVEHTVLVALAGQEILRGKQRREASVSCEDWFHCIAALLCHDIGYVRGVCRQDEPNKRLYVTGRDEEKIFLPLSATDASLTACHVDRGKLFVEENLAGHRLINIPKLKHNIELTRFPVPTSEEHQDTVNYAGLARAADLIGQLADPRYLDKMPALFQEFVETGADKCLGYKNPSDLRAGYPNFFWNVVYRYIKDGLEHLQETREGRQILADLYGNVLIVEREQVLRDRDLPLGAFHPQLKKLLQQKKPRQVSSNNSENIQFTEFEQEALSLLQKCFA